MTRYFSKNNSISRYGNLVASVLLLVMVCAQMSPLTVAGKGGLWFVVTAAVFAMAGYRDAQVLTTEPRRYALHVLWTLAFIVGVDFLTAFVEYAQQTESSLSALMSVVSSHITMFSILSSILLVAFLSYVVGTALGFVQHMLRRYSEDARHQHDSARAHRENSGDGVAMLINLFGLSGRHPLLFLAWYRMGAYYSFVWDGMPGVVESMIRCLYPLVLTCVTLRIQQIWNIRLETEDERAVDAICNFYWDRIRAVDVLFYIAAGVTFLLLMINGTTLFGITNRNVYNQTYTIANCVLFLIALFRMWDDKDRRLAAVQCSILGVGVVLSYLSGTTAALCLLMIAAEGVSAKRVLQLHVGVSLVILTVAAWAAVNGYITYYYNNGTHAMGISYRTTYADYWFYVMVMYRVLRGKHMHLIEYIGSIVLTLYVFHLSAGKTAFVAAVLFLGMCILVDYWPQMLHSVHIDHLIYRLGYAVYPICAAVTFAAVAIKGPEMSFAELDNSSFWYTFQARIALSYEAFTGYPLRLFGQKVYERGTVTIANDLGSNYYFYIDNSFVRFLIIDGIIFFLIMMGVNVYLMVRCHKEQNMIMTAALTAIAIHSLSEPQMGAISYNVLMVLIYAVWDMNAGHS